MSASNKEILKYSKLGNGPEKIIAIHNFWDNKKQYDPIKAYLDTDAFTYVLADVRGYGQSKDIKEEFTAKEAAEDVINLADYLEWKQFHLVGHSMSGMIVQRVAVDAKERIKSIIALTPVSAMGLQFDEPTCGYFASVVSDRKTMFDYFRMSLPMYSKMYSEFRTNRAWESATSDVKKTYIKMWNNKDFSQESKGLNTPMLVVLAEDDPIFNQKVKPFWEKWYPNCEIIMCKNTTHNITDDTPVFIASAIENFVVKHT